MRFLAKFVQKYEIYSGIWQVYTHKLSKLLIFTFIPISTKKGPKSSILKFTLFYCQQTQAQFTHFLWVFVDDRRPSTKKHPPPQNPISKKKTFHRIFPHPKIFHTKGMQNIFRCIFVVKRHKPKTYFTKYFHILKQSIDKLFFLQHAGDKLRFTTLRLSRGETRIN